MKKENKVVKLKKKSVKAKIGECFICSFILLCSFVLILLFSPIFDITQIKVEGNLKLNENIVKSEAGINLGQNILRLNKIRIKEDLLKIPYIEYVEIRREWPDTILIKILEKEPIAKIKLLGSNILIDEEAYILEIVTDDEEYKIPLLSGIETTSTIINNRLECNNQELLEKFLEILKKLKNNDMLKEIIRIEYKDNLLLYTNAGHTINIGDISDLDYKLMRLKAIIAKDNSINSYIDISNINVWPTSKPLWE